MEETIEEQDDFINAMTDKVMNSDSLDELVEHMNKFNDHFGGGCERQISALDPPTFGDFYPESEDYLSGDDDKAIVLNHDTDRFEIVPQESYFSNVFDARNLHELKAALENVVAYDHKYNKGKSQYQNLMGEVINEGEFPIFGSVEPEPKFGQPDIVSFDEYELLVDTKEGYKIIERE